MANELLENKIIWLCVINFWIRWLLFDGKSLVRGREFLGGTWAGVGRKRNLGEFDCFWCDLNAENFCRDKLSLLIM